MRDTSAAIELLLKQRYAALSGSQRTVMALQMFETAQRIVLASLPREWDEAKRRRELCRRFYGDAFTAGTLDRASGAGAHGR
jgi:hypothetical protein